MDFGNALTTTKRGGTVSRQKWNGKILIDMARGKYDLGFFAEHFPQGDERMLANVALNTINGLDSRLFDNIPGMGALITNPVLSMFDVKHQTGTVYNPTFEDMLADDWFEVSDNNDDDPCKDCPVKDQCDEYARDHATKIASDGDAKKRDDRRSIGPDFPGSIYPQSLN